MYSLLEESLLKCTVYTHLIWSCFSDAWQSPQQYYARIRKSEDNSPGFRFLDMEQNNEPSFNEKGKKRSI